MTPQSLVLGSVSNAGSTLQVILAGLPDEATTQKAHPSMLSIAEAVNHLSESYGAFVAHEKGEEHQWGSFQSNASSFDEAVEELFALRDQAVALITDDASESTLKSALDYLANHDWYHIGQIATNRQVFQPEWSSYSLYS
jgi:uncharacterized damage-inducible protein DinB